MTAAQPAVAAPLTYTVPEAAALLGISPWAYYEALKRGELPGRQVGRRWIVSRQRLEEFINGENAP
jgi:excisionase family DNA binding protein